MACAKTSQISLKLLVDTRKKTVLFAEAGKDFVDFLFSLLTMPIGTVIKLISPPLMSGCISNLYQSVQKLNETYLLPNSGKDELLQPNIPSTNGMSPLLLGNHDASKTSPSTNVDYYRCSGGCYRMSTAYDARCTSCYSASRFTIKMTLVSNVSATVASSKDGGERGYVNGVVTYIITDDLEVTPLSAISTITLINKYGVQNNGFDLEEKMVNFDIKQGLALLEASLRSKTVLTEVFFGNSPKRKYTKRSA